MAFRAAFATALSGFRLLSPQATWSLAGRGTPCQPDKPEVVERSISVVLCAYTEERWEALAAAVDSVRRQTIRPREILVVVDHNARLLARVRAGMPDVSSLENAQQPGAGGARNT